MRIALKVTYEDGKDAEVVTAGTADFIAWEARFSRNWIELTKDTTLTDKCFLAWSATFAGSKDAPAFEEWVRTVDFVAVSDGEEIVPLDLTPPTGE